MKKDYSIYFLLFLLSGCSSAYIPSPKNVPLFEKKGEIQLEAGASTNSLYLSGSYAFSEKYALTTNISMSYCDITGKPIKSDIERIFFTDGDVPHRSLEMGLGRYNLFPLSKQRFEIFAGAGYGVSDSFFRHYKNNYLYSFAQANTGLRSKHIEVGWSLRMSYSGFRYEEGNHKSQYDDNGVYQGNSLIIEHGNYQALIFESLFVFRFGGQRLKGFTRGGINLAYPTTTTEKLTTFGVDRGYTMFHLSAGVSYRF